MTALDLDLDWVGLNDVASLPPNFRHQVLAAPGTKNSHGAADLANVKPVAGQQEASPNGLVRLVLPDGDAGRRVQTMKCSPEIPDVQQAVFRDGRSHHATGLARS